MNLYHAKNDPEFQKPYIDIERKEEGYYYVHGGFEGTETRFSFFYPKKEDYKGRFFQFLAPAEGSENASIGRKGMEDKIGFAVSHGAYFVESNMGGSAFGKTDITILYRACAACAEFSRDVARRLFGEHRPYGYLYGGSGGAFKTASCFENTDAWDGAIPYIHGSPMAIPCVFTPRALAKRVLRHAFPKIVDAFEPGGSGNVYEGLSDEERRTLFEVTKMGFPLKSWFYYKDMDDGALPVVADSTIGIDKSYFTDFWTKPGYLGADPHSSVHDDRIVCDCVVEDICLPESMGEGEIEAAREKLTGADSNWKKRFSDFGMGGRPLLKLKGAPTGDVYAYGTTLTVLSGEEAGLSCTLHEIKEDVAAVGASFGVEHLHERLSHIKKGDKVHLDNSNYLAAQLYHRHQLPQDRDYIGWEQYRTADGSSIYPQRDFLVGPLIARGSCGSLQTGEYQSKMMVVAATMDESAFPWQADWYRHKVEKFFGDKTDEHYRLYFFDNSFHDDSEHTVDETHLISYLGGLHQALLDLSDWVERGIEPRKNSVYTIEDSQIVLAEKDRFGLQPIVRLTVSGGKCAEVNVGEEVELSAEIIPQEGTGLVTGVEWAFDDGTDYTEGTFTQTEQGAKATVRHSYAAAGTHFVTCRAYVQREGNKADIYTKVYNLDRARVVVK